MSHIYCIWRLKQIAFVFNDHQMMSEKKKKWFPLLDCFLMERKRGSGDYHIPICSSLPSTKNSISGSEKCLMCERNIKTRGTSLFMKKDIAMQKRLALRPQSQSLRDWSEPSCNSVTRENVYSPTNPCDCFDHYQIAWKTLTYLQTLTIYSLNFRDSHLHYCLESSLWVFADKVLSSTQSTDNHHNLVFGAPLETWDISNQSSINH